MLGLDERSFGNGNLLLPIEHRECKDEIVLSILRICARLLNDVDELFKFERLLPVGKRLYWPVAVSSQACVVLLWL